MTTLTKDQIDRYQTNANSRYYVTITGSTQKAVFSEVGGLQMETEIFEYVEGGNNGFVHRFPGLTKAGNLTLKRGITRGNELFRWYLRVAQGVMDLRSVSVQTFSTSGEPLITWHLDQAFPVKWSGPQFAASGVTVAVESIELAHSGVISIDL
ncbi:phage tail protein [Deinococcus peraridilitoris]|uniref:Conserved hypothetical phage tail region protein n=1 Tax=Deinococcus peraridilitoris (strain DSM 19664 / LMG 22246 / CIP 109416 / KR-200) TaxID=937777 RepID=L0A1D2_DEIPD|nr:phage tail protein [Deinococcus peraridilitoris]AFZ67626.1 conserved hypothetical phage tail region protein [Deinococcus peraridilitoris DSM 19664]